MVSVDEQQPIQTQPTVISLRFGNLFRKIYSIQH